MASKESNVANQILKYLQTRPQASDTLEGIARWWIQNQRLSESVEVVQQALESLKHDGMIEQQKLPDGRVVYSAREPEEE
jgi:Fe2+ or Zn2+ uptake regulation protein